MMLVPRESSANKRSRSNSNGNNVAAEAEDVEAAAAAKKPKMASTADSAGQQGDAGGRKENFSAVNKGSNGFKHRLIAISSIMLKIVNGKNCGLTRISSIVEQTLPQEMVIFIASAKMENMEAAGFLEI